MKTKLLAATAVACLMSMPALAQTTTATGVGVSEANSQSGALAIAGGGAANGNTLNVTSPANTTATVTSTVSGTTTQNVNSRVSGTSTLKTAPSMVAPGLAAAGLETCLGSASGTVSAIGFGIGGGSTYADEGCQARLDSRTLFAYGLKEAAVARLCQRAQVWNSMPQVCERYWPAGMPVPQGVVVIAPGANMTMSVNGGAVRVINGKTGVEQDCLNYSATKQKCYQWAGEPIHRSMVRTAAVKPTEQMPQRIVVKPKPKAPPPVGFAAPEAPKAPEPSAAPKS
jgi:hypothetical protein